MTYGYEHRARITDPAILGRYLPSGVAARLHDTAATTTDLQQSDLERLRKLLDGGGMDALALA